MDSPEFREDLKKIQNRLMSPTSSQDWKALKERIQTWMNETNRPWGHAIFHLLEKGLEYEHYRDIK